MVPSSICADAPLPCYRGVGRWCCGVWARVSEGGGATVEGARILAFVLTIPLAGVNRMCGAGFCRSFGVGSGRG